MSKQPRILLLRSERPPGRDSFVETLQAHQCAVEQVEVMSFHFPHQQSLHTHLLQPSIHHALILTSPRAVRALSLLHDCADLLQAWKHKTCFVVGEATARAASTVGLQSKGEQSGNSSRLADFIIEDLKGESRPDEPLLFLCASKKMDILPSKLKDKGVALKCLQVYESQKKESLQRELSQCLSQGPSPDFILFFSASAFGFSLSCLPQPLPNSQFLAMGQSTAEAMQREGFRVDGTLEKPDVHSLLRVVYNADL